MRVGLVTACWKPVINGVTRMVDAYKNVLESKGHEVALFAFGEPDEAGNLLVNEPNCICQSVACPLHLSHEV